MNVNSLLFAHNMVLQRNVSLELEGTVEKEEIVGIQFQGKEYKTKSEHGQWKIRMNPLEVGGPYELTLTIGDVATTYKDILVGDVYLTSGQSNMETDLAWYYSSCQKDVDEKEYEYIRQFKIPINYNFHQPCEQIPDGSWAKAVGAEKLVFGATGFFFAKQLYEKTKVPIGLVQTAVSGAPIEAFLPKELQAKEIVDGKQTMYQSLLNKTSKELEEHLKKERKAEQEWLEELASVDEGLKSEWQKQDQPLTDWTYCQLPGIIKEEALEGTSGTVWFCKDIVVEEECEQDIIMNLGLIIEADDTYVNGVLVGQTSFQYPSRYYIIPKGVLRKGVNRITVRVIVANEVCRFWDRQEYSIEMNRTKITLEGEWYYKLGARLPYPAPNKTFFEYEPVGVYNAMLYPLKGLNCVGVLWYQGESNTGEPEGYAEKMIALVQEFRRLYENASTQRSLPFYYVQIANYEDPNDTADGTNWRKLREEQAKAEAMIPCAYMIQSYDVSETTNLHPRNKKAIGNRLAEKVLQQE